MAQSYNKHANKTNYLVVPVELIEYSFRERLINELQLFCYYKITSPGHIQLSREVISNTLAANSIAKKETLSKRLISLQNHSLIGFDSQNSVVHLRNWKFIYSTKNFKSRIGAMFDLSDIENFQVWAFTAWIAYKKRVWLRERKQRRSLQNGQPYFGISVRAIRQELGLSHQKIVKLKSDAADLGYLLSIEQEMKRISFIHAKVRQQYDKSFIKIGNSFFIKDHDEMFTDLKIKRKSKNHIFQKGKRYN